MIKRKREEGERMRWNAGDSSVRVLMQGYLRLMKEYRKQKTGTRQALGEEREIEIEIEK